jgi:N-formylglutamate deformylase
VHAWRLRALAMDNRLGIVTLPADRPKSCLYPIGGQTIKPYNSCQMNTILTIAKPESPLPMVFDSPHSGTIYPADFKYACRFEDLQKAEDNFVDDLFAAAPSYSATLLSALFPRSYIDVNRAETDIDPGLLSQDWPFGDIRPTSRSDAGIGLIRRLVKPGTPVYDRPLSPEDIQRRIEHYYRPYHAALKTTLDDLHYRFGQVWHINCHSMPAASAYPKQAIGLAGSKPVAADFVLGDRDGTTCDYAFTDLARSYLKGRGYKVTVNDPFKGVELIGRYAAPARARHSLQIEINKSLYMDEESNQKNGNYTPLKNDIEGLIATCSAFVKLNLNSIAAD